MAEVQKVSGQQTKKQTVEVVLRLMIKLRWQEDVRSAFGKYRWNGNLSQSPQGKRRQVIVVDSTVWIDFLNGRNARLGGPSAAAARKN